MVGFHLVVLDGMFPCFYWVIQREHFWLQREVFFLLEEQFLSCSLEVWHLAWVDESPLSFLFFMVIHVFALFCLLHLIALEVVFLRLPNLLL